MQEHVLSEWLLRVLAGLPGLGVPKTNLISGRQLGGQKDQQTTLGFKLFIQQATLQDTNS